MRKAKPKWDSFAHAYLPGRRREGAMVTQNCVQNKLESAHLQSIGHLRDMTNAFACTKDRPRTDAVADLVPDGAPLYEAGKIGYRYYFYHY